MYCMIISNIQSHVLYKIILRHMIYFLNSFLLKDTFKNMHAVTYRSRDNSKTADPQKATTVWMGDEKKSWKPFLHNVITI